MATKILVVDNYDSFVFNLVQYLGQLGAECTVKRNDEVAASERHGTIHHLIGAVPSGGGGLCRSQGELLYV